MRFEQGDGATRPVGEAMLSGQIHYFHGDSPADWKTNVRRYARIRYANVYPGIDAILHEREGQVELDFEVSPGADPSRVSLAFDGADEIRVEADGRLALRVAEEWFYFSAPEVYQRRGDTRELLDARYQQAEQTRVVFAFSQHDATRPLVIDPVFLGFSTRIGGGGADHVREIATDPAGNLYLTGSTTSSDFAGISTTPVGDDVFVAKIDASTWEIVYVAFFGGDGFDHAWGIEADATGNAYVAGYTTSSAFPTLGGYDSTPDNTDAFLLKLDPNGGLLYGTVYGGGEADGEFNGGIGVHPASGRVYLGSRTNTMTLGSLNAFSTTCPATPCAFIAGFDPSLTGAASLVYASYVTDPAGLSNDEDGGVLDLDVDSSENIYAFGFIHPGADVVLAGQGFLDATGDTLNNDHFLVKLDPSNLGAAQRLYSTFIGGVGDETERGRIAALDSGLVYIGSRTDSTAGSFPVLGAVQATNAGGEDGYVVKVDTTLAGASSQLWGTFLGSAFNDEINSVAVDAAGDVWIAAVVNSNASASFPQVDPIPGAPRTGIDDDAAVAEISSDGSTLNFASPIAAGGISQEQGIVVLPSGRIVVAGTRVDASFPRMGGLPLFERGGNEIAIIGLDSGPDRGLVLEVSDSFDPAQTGDDFAFRYLVRNEGVADAANGRLTTDFPVGLTATLSSANCSMPGSSSTCELYEDIPRGGNVPVYLVASAASDGSYGVNGTVTSDLVDPSSGDDSDSETITTNAIGSAPASLTLADFDVMALSYDIGGFALDTQAGVLATGNGSDQEVVNLMKNDGALAIQIESLLGQGEVALGFVERMTWTPSSGDGADLFGRDFNAMADRVFAMIDSEGRVELRTASASSPGRVIDTGFLPLGRPGLIEVTLSSTNAELLFDGVVVASGDPFTLDSRDALAGNVGDDFVISVGFGTESRGAATISVPEPGFGAMFAIGLLAALGLGVERRPGRR